MLIFSLQYDPVLGHETKGRSEFENMINGFSKVQETCCSAAVQALTAHTRSFACCRCDAMQDCVCPLQSWETKKNECSIAVSAGDKAFLWCA